jgi:1-deoxy-D-xylulose-5-phosphate reductoisomerase
VKRAEEQIREFHPRYYVMSDTEAARDLEVRVKDTDTRVLSGAEGMEWALKKTRPEVAINSVLGEAGLRPTLWSLEAGCRLGLANKESIVIAGDLVMRKAREVNATLIPVDSEHSAIFQCLSSGRSNEVSKLLLTASGGPFFGYTKDRLALVTRREALAHPTWKMGAKITVDSASLMNKGFEVIEAVRLFGVAPEQVEVVVHRQSIIHSAVEYIDRAVVAQMGVPDMRLCVQYAMTYPCRVAGPVAPLDLFQIGTLTFEKPDMEAFPLLSLAYRSVKVGGAMTAALNAANEVAVAAFLEDRIRFADLFEIVAESVLPFDKPWGELSLGELLEADRRARELARDGVAKRAGSV